MTVLQIDVRGVDADDNVVSAAIEVEVTDPPAVPGAGASGAPPSAHAALRPDGFFLAIPGSASSAGEGAGSAGAVPHNAKVLVTQPVRSMTLLRCTGGYR